jgi:PAS domain S-box-containing protein
VRLLHLEDNPRDASLLRDKLEAGGVPCELVHVRDESEFAAALRGDTFDLILTDFSLPAYDGLSALKLARQLQPDTPVIVISGTIGEDEAVQCLHAGARDYLLKARLERLIPAVNRSLQEADELRRRRQAEELLREQASLLDKAQDAIFVRDLAHRITYWNKGAERLYGWPEEEAIGRSVVDLLYRDTTVYQQAYEQVVNTSEWHGELQQFARDGRALVVEGRWTLVLDAAGYAKSVLTINTDITEKKLLEQQFFRVQRMESIGTLAGGIAHDLRNVLSPILTATSLLEPRLTDPTNRRLLSTIRDCTTRGADMVAQVLSFARGMDGRRIEIPTESLIHEIAKFVTDTFPKNIRIRCVPDSNLRSIRGDPTQLYQVLLNLCVNARDAMPDGGTITISAENVDIDGLESTADDDATRGPHVAIQVEDTGAGIPKPLIEAIFDPFFTTKESGQGTGLGLSTTLSLVTSHGGVINVESEPGQGTRFRIVLPAMADVKSREPEDEPVTLYRGHGETVLVVDDEASIREIMRQTLEAFDYRVMLASNGAEALNAYEQHGNEIAVVMIDGAMPVMDGLEATRSLLKFDPSVRIIAMSGSGHPPGEGVTAFLSKPFTAETMLKTLHAALCESR